MAGRFSKIDDPDFAKSVGLAWVEGLTGAEMAEMFGVERRTVTNWLRDPRVKSHAAKFAEERIMRIIRKTDTEIEKRMRHLENEDIATILKVRKEYLNNTVKKVDPVGGGAADAHTVEDTMDALDSNPELAAALQQILESGGKAPDGAKSA